MMDLSYLWMWTGFILAAYSVIGNDSVQTLGTFIASNQKFKWQYLWAATSAVLVFTLGYGWYMYGGDISFGRLNKIPYQEIQWYHAMAPAVLLLLTRVGIPVSTSFLVLSVFASTFVLEKMLLKSMIGYGLAAIIAYSIWVVITKFIDEKNDPVKKEHETAWRVFQWLSTGFLWFTWLSHDMANIAVYLPRQLPIEMLGISMLVLIVFLGYIFWDRGGKIGRAHV